MCWSYVVERTSVPCSAPCAVLYPSRSQARWPVWMGPHPCAVPPAYDGPPPGPRRSSESPRVYRWSFKWYVAELSRLRTILAYLSIGLLAYRSRLHSKTWRWNICVYRGAIWKLIYEPFLRSPMELWVFFFSFAYPFPVVPPSTDLPKISRSFAVCPTLQTLAPIPRSFWPSTFMNGIIGDGRWLGGKCGWHHVPAPYL